MVVTVRLLVSVFHPFLPLSIVSAFDPKLTLGSDQLSAPWSVTKYGTHNNKIIVIAMA
jgi:hypothetical protein